MKLHLLSLALCVMAFTASVEAQPPLGSAAPEIALRNANGEVISLTSLRGKVVLLDFWASWCGPCRQNNRELKSVYKKFHEQGFEIYSVSIDANQRAWLGAVKQDNTPWLHVNDASAARGNELTQTWNIRWIPSTFLLDKQGNIVAGRLEKEELEEWLRKLL